MEQSIMFKFKFRSSSANCMDTFSKIRFYITQILKNYFSFVDLAGLGIWRYIDPALGPRSFPAFDDFKAGKVPLETGVFSINVDTKEVFLTTDTGRVNVGTSLIYVVA